MHTSYKEKAMCCVFFCVHYPDVEDLYIGKAVQKAYLEVTEEGAEGAVGSGIFLCFSPHMTKCMAFCCV